MGIYVWLAMLSSKVGTRFRTLNLHFCKRLVSVTFSLQTTITVPLVVVGGKLSFLRKQWLGLEIGQLVY